MIWFSCKQCGKTHGRPEGSAGSMIFCECGQGNLVPWESTAPEPETPPEVNVPAPAPPTEPLAFDREPPPLPARPRSRSRRRERFQPDPNFCLNHETVPSQKTCADCEEAFCNDCLVTLQGVSLCGPCKNFRIRLLNKPPRASGMALFSLILAVVTGPLAACLIGFGNPIVTLFALLPQVTALVLGSLALRQTEMDPKISGRSMAITGIMTASLAAVFTVILAFYGPAI